jgi:hypothetical protein
MMAATAWPGRYAPGFEARGGPVPPSASLGYDPCPAVNCYPLCSPPPKSPDRCAPPNQRCSCSPPPNRPDRSAPPAGQTPSAAAAPRLRARGGPVPPSASLGYDPCQAVNRADQTTRARAAQVPLADGSAALLRPTVAAWRGVQTHVAQHRRGANAGKVTSYFDRGSVA